MIQAVVTDIEGTTTSLAFVKEVLFPYARRHLADYLREHASDPRVISRLEETRELSGHRNADFGQLVTQLLQWIDEDRKATPLKALQGMVWEHGYRSGDFQGHVFDDAAEALRTWRERGVALYVYSSGSVHAQQLLFGHADHGDLTPLFSGWFDTRIGGKLETDSYRRIAAELDIAPEQILFLSDVSAELDAASEAGMQTCQLLRDGQRDPDSEHRQVRSFDEIAC